MTYPYRYWFDETHVHLHRPEDYTKMLWSYATAEEKPKVIPARIRVTLSRPLTWAEWEHLVRNAFPTAKRDQGVSFQTIHLGSNEVGSRELFHRLASFIAAEFVNVFPTSVWTKQEYVS